ncbi:hypothetical protein MUN82_18020 [Hymenobacter aerilatus]|uniref:Uncharacterized protein n=1 Tax=Hymenobacter aerilatus TaxID=2932251 RepID=A0A8T9SYD2_9BACT|nr:hypothetical protein [Hymenobacter aerilatus]UOR04826.1 hypothetical protein MUN82_18020 [Hymenobacter aerilatus]
MLSTRYYLSAAVGLFLFAGSAQAQLITDSVQATAARDTLFHHADMLRAVAQQNTPKFTTNRKGLAQRRHVVKGRSAELTSNTTNTVPLSNSAKSSKWSHRTIYWYSGNTEERFKLKQAGRTVLREQRINGVVTWLQLQPLLYRKSHAGSYLKEGYVVLDGKPYRLAEATQ